MTDTREVRAAREAVAEAKENIQIANLQKEISGLNDIMDDLDKRIGESNKYYDGLIEQSKKYWDSLIRGLEDYKSRWQELADIEEQAKMGVALRNLNITTDDILNMSGSAFESFRGTYLGLLDEMYAGNDEMLNMLQKFGGISTDTLDPLSGSIESVAGSLDTFAGSTGNANTNISAASESTENLSSSINDLGETTTEILGEPDGEGVLGKFAGLGDTIAEAENHVTGIINGMDELDGMTAECSIRINIETVGGIPDHASDTPLSEIGSMYMKSGEFVPKYASGTAVGGAAGHMYLGGSNHGPGYSGSAHMEGTARVTGDWGVREAGKALVGELGQEIVVSGNGRWRTVGDNGAEFVDLQKGDIVFNHLQTRELLGKGNLVGRGKALAGGTALSQGTNDEGWFTTPDGQVLRPIQPGDRAWELQKAFEPLLKKMDGNLDYLAHNAMIGHQKQMEKMVNQLNAGNVVNNNRNVQPNISVGDINITCPGVTSREVMHEVGVALDEKFRGFHNYADQMSRIR